MAALCVAVAWWYVPRWAERNAIDGAVQAAVQTVNQFKLLRGYYTENVVKKATANGLKAVVEHKTQGNAIPLPATMIHEMGELLSKNDSSLTLYSNYPFPNRGGRVLDEFQRNAWDRLVKEPDAVISDEETREGKRVVRVAIADRMSSEACVACHNSHAQSPKKDWKLGDMRGVLEVATVIDAPVARGAELSNSITLLIGGLVGVLALLSLLAARHVATPLVGMALAMTRLTRGDRSVQLETLGRRDELGVMAEAVSVFKDSMIETERLRAEQQAEQQRQIERGKKIEASVASFEKIIAEMVHTVSSASTELRSTAQAMTATAEETTRQSTTVAVVSEQATRNVQTVATAT